MTKIVSLYNNKGGVAKTTTLFNMSVLLSQRGKKVLLVDCDPQCNCTELFFCSSEDFEDPEVPLPGTSIYEALRPRFDGDASRVDAQKVSLSESSLYDNLFILRGDINFSRAEQYFSNAIAQAVTESIHDKNTYAVMSRLLRDLGAYHGFDYILCDVGPSAGSITRMTILSCDGIFVPTAPDRFSFQAVQGMGAIMGEWLQRHEMITSTFAPYGIDASFSTPAFYGAIVNNYKIHKVGKMKGSYLKWEAMIRDSFIENLLSGDGRKLQVSNPELMKNPFVASIRDVGPTAPVAQIVGKAIFDIAQKDTAHATPSGDFYRGSVWAGWVERMAEYKRQIESIVEAIV
ncbi:Sporulation initiation inhibitor protein soj [Leisingera aquaemixtae]|uniref:Sporulation initiation inhibitor protein soj n=2 Tax=Leisingera aquaemixtae TaxID=1396826 RepID=A0A0P1HE52_9RHOB|nr:Sporulation initiation inhibitor protein soj [Leisingera aquaemixtae]